MEHYNLNDKITDLWNRFNVLFDAYHKDVMRRAPSFLPVPETKGEFYNLKF